jgi:sialate O-acetylesterase
VQLPNFGAVPTEPVESSWSDIREAQRRAVARDAHAGLVVTTDIGEKGDIHPVNKRDVGRRLWRAARHVVYGEAIAPSGVVVTFGDVEDRLLTYSSRQAIAFEPCGASAGSCRFVTADVDGTRVALPTAPSETLTRVRFGWGPSPICNLSDGSGPPVGPFEIPVR